MNQKNENIKMLFIFVGVCFFSMFIMTCIIILFINITIWFFLREGGVFCFSDLESAFRVAIITAPIIGGGTWYLSYKKNKRRL